MTFNTASVQIANSSRGRFLCCVLSTGVAIAALMTPTLGWAADSKPPESSVTGESAEKLSSMFSAEIREILNACAEDGGVNLVQGARSDGSVVCQKSDAKTKIDYITYVDTFSDFVAAGFLVGFRSALYDDPSAADNAKLLQDLLQTATGRSLLKQALTDALLKTQVVGDDQSQASLNILVTEVLKRTEPVIQDSAALQNLIGSESEHALMVKHFCTPPGMSVADAKAKIPGVTSIQLYASCIQASGLATEVNQESDQPDTSQ